MELSIDLDEASVDKAIRELREYADNVRVSAEVMGDLVARQCMMRVNENKRGDWGVRLDDTGFERRVVCSGYTRTDSKGVTWPVSPAFEEFGTGVRNSGGYQGTVPSGYVHGAGTPEHRRAHAGEGWFYNGESGVAEFTHGEPSHPFMLTAAQQTRQNIPTIVRSILRDVTT